jgi:hypothetical protein
MVRRVRYELLSQTGTAGPSWTMRRCAVENRGIAGFAVDGRTRLEVLLCRGPTLAEFTAAPIMQSGTLQSARILPFRTASPWPRRSQAPLHAPLLVARSHVARRASPEFLAADWKRPLETSLHIGTSLSGNGSWRPGSIECLLRAERRRVPRSQRDARLGRQAALCRGRASVFVGRIHRRTSNRWRRPRLSRSILASVTTLSECIRQYPRKWIPAYRSGYLAWKAVLEAILALGPSRREKATYPFRVRRLWAPSQLRILPRGCAPLLTPNALGGLPSDWRSACSVRAARHSMFAGRGPLRRRSSIA